MFFGVNFHFIDCALHLAWVLSLSFACLPVSVAGDWVVGFPLSLRASHFSHSPFFTTILSLSIHEFPFTVSVRRECLFSMPHIWLTLIDNQLEKTLTFSCRFLSGTFRRNWLYKFLSRVGVLVHRRLPFITENFNGKCAHLSRSAIALAFATDLWTSLAQKSAASCTRIFNFECAGFLKGTFFITFGVPYKTRFGGAVPRFQLGLMVKTHFNAYDLIWKLIIVPATL